MKRKDLKKIFKYINRELFDNMLDMPYLYMLSSNDCKKIWKKEAIDGICVPQVVIGEKRPSWYFIGVHKELTKTQIFDTMVHEMIHMHLVEKFNYNGHGKKFKKMCRKAIDTFYYNML